MQVKIVEQKMSSLAPAYLASVAFKYELIVWFGLYVHVWLRVWGYTHIYMRLKMSVRKDIFEYFSP